MFEKKLGFGMMRLPLTDPNVESSIDIPLLCDMVDEFLARGFTYFDTAWMYCGGKSEGAVKEVLTKRHPRDSFTVTSKLPAYKLKSFEDRDKVLAKQLERTGLDYFDFYWLHDINGGSIGTFEKYDCFNWLREQKEKGLVRHIGFSFHGGPELLDRLLTQHPDMEYVQLQINYLDWDNAGVQARANYEVAVKHNKPVIVMEPVKGGTLANLPAEAEALLRGLDPAPSPSSWAIRFAASPDNVVMVLSGMSDMAQLKDNTGYMAHFVPLTAEERDTVLRAADAISAAYPIACTSCSYCTVDCPKNIAIPKYFSLYNADVRERGTLERSWTAQEMFYNSLTRAFGKPADCIQCGKCESMCPQHLPIRQHLKEVTAHFGY